MKKQRIQQRRREARIEAKRKRRSEAAPLRKALDTLDQGYPILSEAFELWTANAYVGLDELRLAAAKGATALDLATSLAIGGASATQHRLSHLFPELSEKIESARKNSDRDAIEALMESMEPVARGRFLRLDALFNEFCKLIEGDSRMDEYLAPCTRQVWHTAAYVVTDDGGDPDDEQIIQHSVRLLVEIEDLSNAGKAGAPLMEAVERLAGEPLSDVATLAQKIRGIEDHPPTKEQIDRWTNVVCRTIEKETIASASSSNDEMSDAVTNLADLLMACHAKTDLSISRDWIPRIVDAARRDVANWNGASIMDLKTSLGLISYGRLCMGMAEDVLLADVGPRFFLDKELVDLADLPFHPTAVFQDLDGNILGWSGERFAMVSFEHLYPNHRQIEADRAREAKWNSRIAAVMPAILDHVDRHGGVERWLGRDERLIRDSVPEEFKLIPHAYGSHLVNSVALTLFARNGKIIPGLRPEQMPYLGAIYPAKIHLPESLPGAP